MSHNSENIRQAIIELLEGTTSSIRQVTSATFSFGVFEGQPDAAQRALVTDRATGTHWFDVEFGPLTDHESTHPANLANSRRARLQVSIPVWTKTATTVEQSARRTLLASIRDDCDTAMQALGYPGNLRQTAAGEATNIASGMLTGLTWRLESAEWDRGLIRSRIEGECMVTLSQLVMASVFGGKLEALYHSSFGFSADGSTWLNIAPLTLGTHDMSQPTADYRPVLSGGSVYCDGVDDFMWTDRDFTFTEGDRPSLIWVGSYATNSPSGNDRAVSMGRNNGGANDRVYLGTFQRGSAPEYRPVVIHSDGGDGTGIVLSLTPIDTDLHAHEIHFLSTGAVALVDGTSTSFGTSAGVGEPAEGSSRLSVGATAGTLADTVFSHGEIYTRMIAVLNDEPTTAELTAMRSWMSIEFGISFA